MHPASLTSVFKSYAYLCKLQLAAAVGPARAGRQRRMPRVGGVRGRLLVLLRLLVLRVQQLRLRVVLLWSGRRLLIVRGRGRSCRPASCRAPSGDCPG